MNLALFFTYGTSLEDWIKNGTIEREVDIYKRFAENFDKIYFLTYGKNDGKYQNLLPKKITVLPKKYHISNQIYSFIIPFVYSKEIKDTDWLKTNQIMGSWSAILAKIFFKKKLFLRTGYTESLFGRTGLKKILISIIEWLAYKNCNLATVTSNSQKAYLEKRYGARSIFVIPNGINTKIFKPTKKMNPSTKTLLFSVGRLHPEKNLLNLLEAIRGLEDVKMKIIGKGPLEKYMLKFKEDYGLDLEIISSVPNNQLPEMYNAADIYIQPSLFEGNPKTILEAMSCGLPIIATNIEGINNVIINEENGCLCKTDSQSIRKTVLKIIKNHELREKIGANARKSIEENYDLNKLIEKELEIYGN